MEKEVLDIRRLREEQKLTVKYVAWKTGMSISYLSELERQLKPISYSNYVKILDVLGYEIRLKKKDCMEEFKMNNVVKDESVKELESDKKNYLSDKRKVELEKIIDILSDMDHDCDMLIKAFKYILTYIEYADEDIAELLCLLRAKDKELLESFNDKFKKIIDRANKNPETWSDEEIALYKSWINLDGEVYYKGDDERREKFNLTKEDVEYSGDPMTVREYTLKDGTPISVIYCLTGDMAKYSYDLRTEEEGNHAIKETSLLLVRYENIEEVSIIDENIMNQLSDEDKQEALRLVKESSDFEQLFAARLNVAYELSHHTKDLILNLYKSKVDPNRYTDEYIEYIKPFYI